MVGATDVRDRRRDLYAEIAAPEPDPGVSGRGLQGERNFMARVKADTGTSHLASKGPLKSHHPLAGSGNGTTEMIAILIPIIAKPHMIC
jgi:hypothetical protein